MERDRKYPKIGYCDFCDEYIDGVDSEEYYKGWLIMVGMLVVILVVMLFVC